MHKLAALLLPLAFLAFPAQAATVPGAIPGNFGVGESGAATYSIPLAVPPGTAGMEPKLSLDYSSQGGNGLAGVGWSLGGLSAITRCTVDPAPNRSVRITFTNADRFCLDGQRLIAVSGTYGASGTVYRTERESFSRIVSNGAAGSGPASFTVQTQAGLVMEYGVGADARILAEGRAEARVWALGKVSDTAGNYFTIAYAQDTAADYVPTRIDYAGNAAAGTAPVNAVEFVYEPRPDPATGYVAGVRVGSTQRLIRLRTWAGETPASDYTLDYDRAPVTGRSRLVSLTRCAGDGACLAPTRFTWSDGELASYGADGETATPAGTVNDLTFALGDMNADGLTDALIFDTRINTFHAFHTLSGSGMETRPFVTVSTTSTTQPIGSMKLDKRLWLTDTNSDGRADPIVYGNIGPYGGKFLYGMVLWFTDASGDVSAFNRRDNSGWFGNGSSYTLASSAYASAAQERWFIVTNNDGDGFADFTAYLPTIKNYGSPYNQISRSETYPGAVVADSTTPVHSFFESADINGDGLADALRYDPSNGLLRVWQSDPWQTRFRYNPPGLPSTPLTQTLSTGGSPLDRWFELADVNGDGLGDLVLHTPANGQLRTWLARGDGTFAPGADSSFVGGGLPADTWFQMVDVNADGLADAVKYNPIGGTLTYALSLGDGGFGTAASVYLGAGPLPTPHIGPAPHTQWFSPADINGDGVLDWVRYAPESGRIKVNLGQGGVPDLLQGIVNGLGHETRIDYKPLTDSAVYTKGTGAVYPEQDVQNAMRVVARVETDDGVGGFAANTYTYAGLKARVDGGGVLGFTRTAVLDEQTGIRTATEFRQDAPYTGLVARTLRTAANGVELGRVENTYANKTIPGGGLFVYLSYSNEQSRDLNGTALPATETWNTFDDWGNLTRAIVQTSDGFKKQTDNVYANDTAKWHLGRLTRASVASTAGGATQTRVSAFEYHPTTGLLTKEIIEPDQPQYRLDTTYAYDAFGNKVSATVGSPATGTAAIVARTTNTTYDANGQFPVVASNALAHSETKTFDPRFGIVKTLVGPNGLTTTWQYDGFGRKTRETRADGSFTVWTYDACDAACPANGVYRIVTQTWGGGIQSAPASVAYYDRLNRAIRTATQGFDGRWVYADTVYDGQGRARQVSRPYFAGGVAAWTVSEYDELDRLVRVFEPDEPGTPALSVQYNGLTIARTNRKGQTTSETRNSQGQRIAVVDALGQTTAYAYDPNGNLATVTAPGSLVTTNVYDIRGRKTQTTDPDLGLWKYEYNALGELVKQTDAKNQVTTMVYDKLGRMTRRVEPGLTSDWVFDASPTAGKGKLFQATTSAGYVRSHYYDAAGRPWVTLTDLGAGEPFLWQTAVYDAAGRLSQTWYPNGSGIRTAYNPYGYVSEVRNANDNALYWRADAMDAEGRVVRETYGNGVVTERGFDPLTGRLQNIAGYKGSNQIQGHAYLYDTLGNVAIVADGPGSQLEIRGGYDALNRLTQTEIYINGVASQQNLAYDAIGNILSKTGVGNYAYGDALHKHAVTGVTGGPVNHSYAYDANGNLTGGAGRSITWTSWNMPASLTQSGQTQSWSYTPEHDRYQLTASGRTTWYLNPGIQQGGHYERTLYASGTVEHRITLYGGGQPIGEVLTFDSGAPAQTRYYHSDQQGSITAVTDQTGTVVARYRYDPWGKQTQTLGAATGIGQTRQGHTGHEMLDGGLTHMNGRLYDPVLARFVSADPHVDNPFDLQSLNRYSYVNNNPLGFTDPSGYFKIFGKKWSWWRDKVVKPVVAIAISTFAPNPWVGGFFAGLVASGGNLKAGIIGGLTAGAFSQLHGWTPKGFAEGLGKTLAHGVIGGISSELSGGDFRSGFLAAGFTQGVSLLGGFDNLGDPETLGGRAANAIGAAVVGGTASAIGGGKFANGR